MVITVILTITKFSTLIGSAHAYLSRNWHAITWVSIQLQVSNLNNFKLDTCNWTPMPSMQAR